MAETTQKTDDAGGEPTSKDILDVNGLTKVYPDGTVAVEDISFSIADGDFCVLIGPSGCGKSTTLHSLVGKFPITDGEVLLDGDEITDTETYKRDIGLVFQDFQLFPHLTVEENIRYGLERLELPNDEIERRVSDLSETMQLEGMLERSPEELSAGQKQRVALARSLVLEPKLLLLDEPLGDMDYKLQKRMERELLRIHREFETTFVYVTHDQTQAMRLADQIIVMNDGKIEQSGSSYDVYNEPETAFVATFVGDSNLFSGEVVGLSESGTRARIETEYGEFLASTSNLESEPTDVVGEEIPFSIRPQYIRVDETAENTLECDLLDVINQPGSGTQLLLEAHGADGSVIELQVKLNEQATFDTETIRIGWDVADTTMLERASVISDIDLKKDVLGE